MNNPIIKIQNLTKTFYDKNESFDILENINLDINQGEIFGIIGSSGAGKSTLVRCINLLEQPSSGSIFFCNKDLSLLSKKDLNRERKLMSMIFQQFNLLMQRTAAQNIAFPLELSKTPKKVIEKRVIELLELVGLTDKSNAYPSTLSGGQKQRVAIARALATNPKVLLCDEATSALDPNTTQSILSLLKKINKSIDVTIIIITHEMSVIEDICDRVAIIDNKEIVEIGNVKDIFSNPKTNAAKKIVLPHTKIIENYIGKSCFRIVFNGNSSSEPILSNMILKCSGCVNILYADTRNIEDKTYGEMVIALPENKKISEQMVSYLLSQNLVVEEISDYA